MARGRSEAQKAQIKTLAATRKTQLGLPTALTSLSLKTRTRADKKKIKDVIQQQETLVDDLSLQLKAARGEIAASCLEIQRKDDLILELNLKIVNCKDSALSRSQESDILVEKKTLELRKVWKRSQRLTNERRLMKVKHDEKIRRLTASIMEARQNHLAALEAHALAKKKIQSLHMKTQKLENLLSREKSTNNDLRKKAHRLDMQCSHAQASLHASRTTLKSKMTWSAKKGGVYTVQARWLARELLKAGCSSERVGDATLACAKAFGMEVQGKMSGRTVLQARDEGGYFGLMQLGHEITQSSGLVLVVRFGESSDGTAHQKITYEAHHATLAVPSYAPGVDDSDVSTWTSCIQFIEVEPALNHTAKTQFDGTKHLASRIATAYSECPLSGRNGTKMDTKDWVQKEEFQNIDHAADGKKKFNLTAEWKEEVICEDLGEKAMDDMDADEILRAMFSIPQEDIDAARTKNPADHDSAAMNLLERRLGKTVLDALQGDERKSLVSLLFAGCCGHKDLNAFKYGVQKMMATWELKGRPPPVLLANKANDAVIRLGEEADTAAVQRAVDSSSQGGVKLASLAGALFNHKSEEQGYQDVHRMFMTKHKREIHGITRDKNFPDTFNHLEQNVAKGLEDASTLAEMAAMALYGNAVSWPYLNQVRGAGGTVVNLLDPSIITLHRRLPDFCNYIAANPQLLLESITNGDFSKITLDGKPWMDGMLVMSIQILASELPDLELMISSMFSGCVDGWYQFTQEFVPGGPIDQLTSEQRSQMFIPATNDANEGALGSWRVHARFHPNGTASGFSNKTRVERNNTEMFIDKLCEQDDQRYVMRQVRIEGASGANAKFREHLLKSQQARALATRKKQQDAEKKKREEIARLTTVGLVVDRTQINRMTVPQLNDQISIHRKFLNDEVLLKVPQKDIKHKIFKLSAVLAAITRNEEKIAALCILVEKLQEPNQNSEDLENSGDNPPLEEEEMRENDEENDEYDDDDTY
ncbi:hypothetical protein BYT27DRAFT_7244470 [Phlegmacium glaucopus]|nr:hypothetical protein BYT27DRAFT_7244470 [Phlegmacium glaucopus]